MFNLFLFSYITLSLFSPIPNTGLLDVAEAFEEQASKPNVLATRSISLDNRVPGKWVNDVFKDNILLTLSYLGGETSDKADINWDEVRKPKTVSFTLNKGETFAFHDQIMDEYIDSTVKTTNAHFNYSDGFKSDGYLMGDGVCHFASLIYWVAKDAGLLAVSPTNHDFAVINEVPKEYGVSIYFMPDGGGSTTRQNLYITNNFDEPVTFTFNFDGSSLSLDVTKSN